MSATTTWKCPNDGLEWAVTYRKCPTCGYANMPACVALVSERTGKTAELGGTTRLGKAVFKQRFADDEADYAAQAQFDIVRDTDTVMWVLRPIDGVRNKTHYNGAEVPAGGCELTEGGVITIGRTRMRLTVRFR
jgi:hypothetical protein